MANTNEDLKSLAHFFLVSTLFIDKRECLSAKEYLTYSFKSTGVAVAETSKAPDGEQRSKAVGDRPCQQFFNPRLQNKSIRHPQSGQ